MKLKSSIAAARVGETVPIESPARASKSNGMMEHAIHIWQGELRTIKHDVESRIGKRIEPGSALFTWLIPFCAGILNKFRVGGDGRIAHERISSHACKVAGFAEVVDFEFETDKNDRNQSDSEFNEGVFLGYAWRSTESHIAAKGVIYKCRTA